MLSLIRAWRTGEKCPLSYPPMFVKRQKAQISKLSTLSFESPCHSRACCGLKSSTTALLITSARHGNFVTQNRNALFWWDSDPWACLTYYGQVLVQLFPIYACIYSVTHIDFYAFGDRLNPPKSSTVSEILRNIVKVLTSCSKQTDVCCIGRSQTHCEGGDSALTIVLKSAFTGPTHNNWFPELLFFSVLHQNHIFLTFVLLFILKKKYNSNSTAPTGNTAVFIWHQSPSSCHCFFLLLLLF